MSMNKLGNLECLVTSLEFFSMFIIIIIIITIVTSVFVFVFVLVVSVQLITVI